MEIDLLCKDLEDEYEKFLKSIDDSFFYYSVKYKNFLEKLLNCQSKYILVKENKKIKGVFPYMQLDGEYGTVINSLPFYGSNGSVLAVDKTTENFLYNYIEENIMSSNEYAAVTIVTHPFRQIENNRLKYDYIDERIGQFTKLNTNEEDMMNSIDGSTRRNIRKAEKSNVKVFIDNKSWDFLEKIHKDNMCEIGGNAKSHDFFDKARNQFEEGKDYNIYIAEIDGECIAGLLLFYFNKTVEYFTPVTINEFRNYQPTALIVKKAMMDAAESGYSLWNWGGTWKTQDGVYRFKKKWGAEDFNYKYYIKLNNKGILKLKPEELLNTYRNFYTIPFSVLEN